MKNPNLSAMISAAWEEAMRDTPNPFNDAQIVDRLFGKPKSYRHYLTAPQFNSYGQRITQSVIVRRNIRLLRGRQPYPPASRFKESV